VYPLGTQQLPGGRRGDTSRQPLRGLFAGTALQRSDDVLPLQVDA
jgi:hypothetical protein